MRSTLAHRKTIPDLDFSQLIMPPSSKLSQPQKNQTPSVLSPTLEQKVPVKKQEPKVMPIPEKKGVLIQTSPISNINNEVHLEPDKLTTSSKIEEPSFYPENKTSTSDTPKEPKKALDDTIKVKPSTADEVEARFKERQQKLASILNQEKTSI